MLTVGAHSVSPLPMFPGPPCRRRRSPGSWRSALASRPTTPPNSLASVSLNDAPMADGAGNEVGQLPLAGHWSPLNVPSTPCRASLHHRYPGRCSDATPIAPSTIRSCFSSTVRRLTTSAARARTDKRMSQKGSDLTSRCVQTSGQSGSPQSSDLSAGRAPRRSEVAAPQPGSRPLARGPQAGARGKHCRTTSTERSATSGQPEKQRVDSLAPCLGVATRAASAPRVTPSIPPSPRAQIVPSLRRGGGVVHFVYI